MPAAVSVLVAAVNAEVFAFAVPRARVFVEAAADVVATVLVALDRSANTVGAGVGSAAPSVFKLVTAVVAAVAAAT